MEGDCNAYALIAVNVPIMRMVYELGQMHRLMPQHFKVASVF